MADLRIMYGLHGERRIPEQVLGHLSGYEGSAPVRIGNGAAGQYQLDVWGEVLDGLHVAREAGLAPSADAGYDAERNTFTQFYGSHGLDAALLLMPRVGFLPDVDGRVAARWPRSSGS